MYANLNEKSPQFSPGGVKTTIHPVLLAIYPILYCIHSDTGMSRLRGRQNKLSSQNDMSILNNVNLPGEWYRLTAFHGTMDKVKKRVTKECFT